MTFTSDLLNQDDVWIDGDLQVHQLDEMDRHHRANLIPFLRGNVLTLYIAAHPDGPSEDVADRGSLEEWLEATPLMRRLVDLERGRPIEDRAATDARNRAYELATGYQKVRTS